MALLRFGDVVISISVRCHVIYDNISRYDGTKIYKLHNSSCDDVGHYKYRLNSATEVGKSKSNGAVSNYEKDLPSSVIHVHSKSTEVIIVESVVANEGNRSSIRENLSKGKWRVISTTHNERTSSSRIRNTFGKGICIIVNYV